MTSLNLFIMTFQAGKHESTWQARTSSTAINRGMSGATEKYCIALLHMKCCDVHVDAHIMRDMTTQNRRTIRRKYLLKRW